MTTLLEEWGPGQALDFVSLCHYARVPTLHVCVRSELEDTVLFVLDDKVSKRLGVVPCGCVRMKVSPLGPEFTYLATRRHTSQIMYIRLDRWAHTWQPDVTPVKSCTSAWTAGRDWGASISAVVEDKLSCPTTNVWMNADDCSIMNLDLDCQDIITVNC